MDPSLPAMVRSASVAAAGDHELAKLLREVDSTTDSAKPAPSTKKKKRGNSPRSKSMTQLLQTPAKIAPQQLPPLSNIQRTAPPRRNKEAWNTPAGDAGAAKTGGPRVRVAEPKRLVPGEDAAHEPYEPEPRSPTFSPRRTSKLAGTTLTSSLTFMERDLSLNRAAAQAGKAQVTGQATNVTTAEAWLEDMLELVKIKAADGSDVPEAAHGMERASIDRKHLSAAGMDTASIGRLYQLLFVHSFGMHQSLSAVLEPLSEVARAQVAVSGRRRPPHSAASTW